MGRIAPRCRRSVVEMSVSPASVRNQPRGANTREDVRNGGPGVFAAIGMLGILSMIGTTIGGDTEGSDSGTANGAIETGVAGVAGTADTGVVRTGGVEGETIPDATAGVLATGAITDEIVAGAIVAGVMVAGVVWAGMDAASVAVPEAGLAAGADGIDAARAAENGAAWDPTVVAGGSTSLADCAAPALAEAPLSAGSGADDPVGAWPARCGLSPRLLRPPPRGP